ncbi:MAG TPA: SPW repeat protein [Patescibacteria group bacterium]|nr:SPW repeat protein [Patescibacteria group bacterium]
MNTQQASIFNGINAVIGVALLVSPFVLGVTNTAQQTNDIIFGIIIGVLSLIRAFYPSRSGIWMSWFNTLFGIWLILAPFALGYAASHLWHDVIAGVIVAGLSLWDAMSGTTSAPRTRGAAI